MPEATFMVLMNVKISESWANVNEVLQAAAEARDAFAVVVGFSVYCVLGGPMYIGRGWPLFWSTGEALSIPMRRLSSIFENWFTCYFEPIAAAFHGAWLIVAIIASACIYRSGKPWRSWGLSAAIWCLFLIDRASWLTFRVGAYVTGFSEVLRAITLAGTCFIVVFGYWVWVYVVKRKCSV